MERKVTHKKIVDFHQEIVAKYKGLKGFYRFNWNEIEGQFRSGVQTPALLLESTSSDFTRTENKVGSFNNRRVSFLILDFAGKVNDFDKQEEVLNTNEGIALDIAAYIKTQSDKPNHWLYGLYDVSSLSIEKVGPIFDNMFGWNVLYTLKNKESMMVDPDKWE